MEITIKTTKPKEVVDITEAVENIIKQSGVQNGLCNIFVLHTTAAIATADLDPGTDLDYLDALEAVAPHLQYRHPHDPSHFPDHLLSTLIGPEVTVPIYNDELVLGTWQEVVLFEFDGPRDRIVHITILPNTI